MLAQPKQNLIVKGSLLRKKAPLPIDSKFNILLQVFKEEANIELWIKSLQDSVFRKAKTYDLLFQWKIGAKAKTSDHQVPEGIYHIDRFNPKSNYHLSLGINYPTKSDLIRGHETKTGGDIFIHGNCVSIGCLPILDQPIEELCNKQVTQKVMGKTKFLS